MIRAEFQARVGASDLGASGNLIKVRMSYIATHDPFGVVIEFTEDGLEGVGWVVGRELLMRGITSTSPYGQGDFKLRRAGNTVICCLTSHEGHADVLMPYGPLRDFLSATTDSVPVGEEKVEAELDSFLKELFEA